MMKDILLLIAFWAIFPGLMFVIARIAESRTITLNPKVQSTTFWPGELALGVMLIALWKQYGRIELESGVWKKPEYFAIIIIATIIFGYVVRRHDASFYKTRAEISPTKVFHDLVGYFVVPMIVAYYAVPLFWEGVVKKTIVLNLVDTIHFVAAIVFYLVCLAIDAQRVASEDDIYKRHPHDWKPSW